MRLRVQGFTLIEISIVLAVVGLIITGVLLSGGTIFGRAGVSSLLASIKDLAAASRDFKARYGYFPGDLPNAQTYITTNGGVSAACNYPAGGTTGNGIVDTSLESDCSLEHLLKAGMLTKLDFDKANNHFVINSNAADGVRILLSYKSDTNENVIKISNLPCELALEIDRKFDSATNNNTPFLQGFVTGDSAVSIDRTTLATQTNPISAIANCIPGDDKSFDPVPTVMIKY
jgi:prepilin-type N-terminal cleavage/methylation domain-containing protein